MKTYNPKRKVIRYWVYIPFEFSGIVAGKKIEKGWHETKNGKGPP